MANYYGSLEAVDCHIHSVRYDMAVNRGACGRLRWPHQVTYDVVAWLVRVQRACTVSMALAYIVLYYPKLLQWVIRSCSCYIHFVVSDWRDPIEFSTSRDEFVFSLTLISVCSFFIPSRRSHKSNRAADRLRSAVRARAVAPQPQFCLLDFPQMSFIHREQGIKTVVTCLLHQCVPLFGLSLVILNGQVSVA